MGEKLNEVGQKLQLFRENLGMDVEEIAQRLKISSEYLRALEAGDVKRLPESVYVTGYITGYARIVGLPSEELVKAYREDHDVKLHDPTICFAKLEIQLEHVGGMTPHRSVMPMVMVPLFLVLLIVVIWLQSVLGNGTLSNYRNMLTNTSEQHSEAAALSMAVAEK